MRLAIATGTLATLTIIACSSGGSGGGSTATSSGFGQQFCALLEPCCAQAGLDTSGTLCAAFVQSAANKGTYDPAAGQDCLNGLKAESGSATFCTSLGNDVPACNHVFGSTAGTVAPGGQCTSDSQCAPAPGGGATCYDTTTFLDGGTTTSRTCIQTTPGKAGDGPCIGTVDGNLTIYSWNGQGAPPTQGVLCNKADGLTCSSATQQCTALANPGETCTSTGDCVSTAYCDFTGSNGQCVARLADGADCTSAPDGCSTSSYCEPSSHACTPYVAPGSPCTLDQQCQYGCVNGTCSKGGGNLGLAFICG